MRKKMLYFLFNSSKTDGNSTVVSKHRVAKLAWHTDASSPVVARISRRTEDMTGLTTQTAETLQVQNYGIGGLYVPHFDYHDNRYHWEAGNRIATTLYYVSIFKNVIRISK